MILLSNILKAASANFEIASEKVIGIKPFFLQNSEPDDTQEETEKGTQVKEDAGKQAEIILAEARARAAKLLEEAEKDAADAITAVNDERTRWEQEKQVLAEEARSSGYQQGLIEGRNAAENEYRNRLEEAAKIVSETKRRSQKRLEDSEFQLLSLGLRAAEQIVKTELDENKVLFRNIVTEVIKEARTHGEIDIYVHPEQFVLISDKVDDFKEALQKEVQFSVYPDDRLEPLSCILESSFGRIDASVDSQLSEIRRKLTEMMESGRNDGD